MVGGSVCSLVVWLFAHLTGKLLVWLLVNVHESGSSVAWWFDS